MKMADNWEAAGEESDWRAADFRSATRSGEGVEVVEV